MNNYVKLLNNLEELGLLNIKASIDKYIDLINSGNKSIVDAVKIHVLFYYTIFRNQLYRVFLKFSPVIYAKVSSCFYLFFT